MLLRRAKERQRKQAEEQQKKQLNLDEMTVDELKKLAKEKGIKGYSHMKADELREALKNAE